MQGKKKSTTRRFLQKRVFATIYESFTCKEKSEAHTVITQEAQHNHATNPNGNDNPMKASSDMKQGKRKWRKLAREKTEASAEETPEYGKRKTNGNDMDEMEIDRWSKKAREASGDQGKFKTHQTAETGCQSRQDQ
ncbi:hypothetical protein DITRI_Ditri02bG0156000 [Diplodiscus trichospermus]